MPTDTPDGLSLAFATDESKQGQWLAFKRNVGSEAPGLDVVVAELEAQLMAIVRSA